MTHPTLPAASGLDAQGSWMGQALHDFTEYFVKNYPGLDTIICDPTWHAPRIFRNALWHIEQAQKRDALAAQPAPGVGGDALALAVRFHETYERLAPSFGYETRTDTRTFDPESKNGRLMVAVCRELLSTRPAELVDEEMTRLIGCGSSNSRCWKEVPNELVF